MIRHHEHQGFASRLGPTVIAALLIVCGLEAGNVHSARAAEPLEPDALLPPERPDDPPGVPASSINGTTAAATISFGRFTSIQVNVNAVGTNITRDAANEPSIAVDPNDPSRIAIGWRQFDTDKSNFRQAGIGYSTDGGQSFQSPSFIPNSLIWGTLDVGPDGTLYMVGTNGVGGPIYVARSTDAQTPTTPPTFTTVSVNLGGTLRTGGPNPAGLLGQLWIAVDRSTGPRSGWVYVLASVQTATDPLDVLFIRSTDGGQTWSTPVRVNDDPAGNRAFQVVRQHVGITRRQDRRRLERYPRIRGSLKLMLLR